MTITVKCVDEDDISLISGSLWNMSFMAITVKCVGEDDISLIVKCVGEDDISFINW